MRRRAREVKRFLEERRRARTQGKDLYVILDNFGSHRALRMWESRQRGPGNLHLVWLPIQSPWLNLVERFFLDLQRDVLDNSDFVGVRELGRAIYRYVEWWNQASCKALCPRDGFGKHRGLVITERGNMGWGLWVTTGYYMLPR